MKKTSSIILAACAACLMPLTASAQLYNIQLAGYPTNTYSGAAYVGLAGDQWNNPDWTGVYTGSTNLFTGVSLVDSTGASNGVTVSMTALYNTSTTNWNTDSMNHYSGQTAGSANPAFMEQTVKSDYENPPNYKNVHTITISGLPANTNLTVYTYGTGNGVGSGSKWSLGAANTNGGVSTVTVQYDDSATGRDVTLGTSEGTGWGRIAGTTDGSGSLVIIVTGPDTGTWWQTYINGIQVDVGNTAVTVPIISGLDDVTSFVGFDVTLTPVVSGIPSPTYQWQENGTNLVAETNVTLSLTNLQLGQSGNVYTLIASNSAGSDTNSMTLTVLEPTYGSGRYNIQLNGFTTPRYTGAAQVGTTNDVWNVPEWVGVESGTTDVFTAVGLVDSSSNVVSVTASMTSLFNNNTGAWNTGTFNRYANQNAGSATPDLMDHAVKMDYSTPLSLVNAMTITLSGLPAGSNATVYAYGAGTVSGSGGQWTLDVANGGDTALITYDTNSVYAAEARDATSTNSQGLCWEVLNGTVDGSGNLTLVASNKSGNMDIWWQIYMNGIQVVVDVPPPIGPTEGPVITSIDVAGTDVTLAWTDEGVGTYTIQRKTDMTATNWMDVLPGLPAGLGSTNVTASGADQEFYQIIGE